MNLLDWINQGIDNLTQYSRPRNGSPWFPYLRGAAHDHDGVVWSPGGTVVRPRRTRLQLRKFVDFVVVASFAYTFIEFYDNAIPGVGYSFKAVHHVSVRPMLPTSSARMGSTS